MSGIGSSPPQGSGQAVRTVSNGGSSGNKSSALSVMMEKGRDIVGREVDVASWNLKKGQNWSEVRMVVRDGRERIPAVKPKTSNKYVSICS